MRRIFTLSMALVCLTAISNKGFSQICPSVIAENFNSVANGTAGFIGSPVANFSFNSNSLQYLVDIAPGQYTLTTPVYQLPSTTAPNIDYGFTVSVGNRATLTKITASVVYVNNVGTKTTTTPSTVISSSSLTSASSSICGFLPTPNDIIKSGYSANSFQIIYTFYVEGLTGQGARSFYIDDYRTTSTFSQIILPVHFSNIAVRKATEGAQLTWSVGTELNVGSYDVEKSTDGRSFTKIGNVVASGQSSYSFIDAKAGVVNFYRVKSVDVDGKFGYSTVVSFNNGASSVVIKAFMSDKNTLTVQHDAAQGGSRISVISMDGRVVKVQLPAAGAQQTKVDMSNAPTGLYIIRYDNGQGGSESIKVAK